jgi:FKBP-type peptidyl-prolyl cis-trans isomerase
MKKILIIALIIPFGMNIHAQKVKKVKLKTETDSLSYALGLSLADNLSQQKVKDLNPLAIARAFQDYYKKEAQMENQEAKEYVQTYFMKQGEAKQKEEEKKFEKIKKEGEEFLKKNAEKEGVVTLESGLQYKVLKEGTGNSPTTSDNVKVHYEGTLADGTKFDSSYDRGEPIVFGVTQVIKGWTEALQLMKEGSVWMIYIPHELAYGSRGAGDIIKPFSALIFKVELIAIEK